MCGQVQFQELARVDLCSVLKEDTSVTNSELTPFALV